LYAVRDWCLFLVEEGDQVQESELDLLVDRHAVKDVNDGIFDGSLLGQHAIDLTDEAVGLTW
jgi:hypothetical protein